MSRKNPIIAVTGSSGAGTTTVMESFKHIFRREKVRAQIVEGDAFHRYDRKAMRAALKEAEATRDPNFSHFGPEANLFEELEALFANYGENGGGRVRKYLHDDEEAAPYAQDPGTFTPWRDFDQSDLLFYEGLHGAVVTDELNLAQHADLKIGVVPVINLEWIQKIHRDKAERGRRSQPPARH